MHSHRRVAILGVTGLIGHGLPPLLAARGWRVTGISRGNPPAIPGIDAWQTTAAPDLSGCDAVINLAGEPIDKRWTRKARQRFRESRVGLTAKVVDAIRKLPPADRPATFLSGSAVGIYGDRGDEPLDDSASTGDGFLASLCRDWEGAAHEAEPLGVRVVTLRTGVVLTPDGGALHRMLPAFKLGLGAPLGNGRQWMPWIHIDDERAAIIHALESQDLNGPLNLTAPVPETNRDFTRKLAAALRRPAFLRAPEFALRLMLGEFATALVSSQRALPAGLERSGFRFSHPRLEEALRTLPGLQRSAG